MIDLLRLIRFPNLVVVLITQALVYYRLLKPALSSQKLPVQLSELEFWLLSAACVCVTAGGYIINDLLDADGDAINRPEKKTIQQIGAQQCRYLYLMLVMIGFGLSFALCFSTGKQHLLWLYPTAVGLLALYSRYIKPMPLAGNLLVALFCAGVPALIALAEWDGLQQLTAAAPRVIRLLLVYTSFAFLTTLLREIVKDLEDVEGDQAMGRRTLPIVLGNALTKVVAAGLFLFTVAALLMPWLFSWAGFSNSLATSLLLVLVASLLGLLALMLRASKSAQYHQVSSGLKWVMLLGLLLLGVV